MSKGTYELIMDPFLILIVEKYIIFDFIIAFNIIFIFFILY